MQPWLLQVPGIEDYCQHFDVFCQYVINDAPESIFIAASSLPALDCNARIFSHYTRCLESWLRIAFIYRVTP
jgi:hypothetical protein